MSTIAMILAGGEGRRLLPLTAERSKPAVPFGGRYRIVDFVLSNLVNSGVTRIKVLTQFKADSLIRHLSRGWQLSPILNQYIDATPAQMRKGRDWYRGTADAIYQNIDFIEREKADYVFVVGGDHIYKMDMRQKLAFHIKNNADLTVSALPYPREKAKEFGVIEATPDMRIRRFHEKPRDPQLMPGSSDMSFVSMGNYIFSKKALVQIIKEDAAKDTEHDFGKNIISSMLDRYNVFAYDFSNNVVPGAEERERGYWRDVGNLDQYWEASMDLVNVTPVFNLYNDKWPISCYYPPAPPAKFVFADIGGRAGIATDSLISEGSIISGGRVNRCVLSPHCRINSYAHVEESVLMEGVTVGRNTKIRRAIIDKHVHVPSDITIGYNRIADEKRFSVTESGITVVAKGACIERGDCPV